MSTPRDPDRFIRAFLAEGPQELPDRTFDAVRGDIEHTRQRVVIGPWREPQMNNLAKVAIALAAVVVVAVVGLNLLPGSGGVGRPGSSPTPSPTLAPTPNPSQSPSKVVIPDIAPAGPLAAGTHQAVYGPDRLPFSFTVPTGWTSVGWFITNDPTKTADGYQLRLTFTPVANTYTDPCQGILATPAVGPQVQDLAAALQALPGTTNSSSTAVVLGGRPATLVEYTIRADNTCANDRFFLWRDPTGGDFYTWPPYGDLVRTWIVDVDGTRFVAMADIQLGTSAADQAELQQVIDSITFGG